jgi:ubiquinone/menaquinone biosynthesis C-methylase UbiE
MKSATDRHWNERAISVANDIEVNIMDVFQRELEYDYVCRYLQPEMRLLEVGCGNGFSTRRFREFVAHVDAFDYAEQMVERARASVGEKNNHFIVDNVLHPQHLDGPYDAVVCIRVLINLSGLEQQRTAFRQMARLTKSGGMLLIAEGFTEGFVALSALREELGMPPIQPAAINFYSSIDDLRREWRAEFDVEDEFHLGAYDYLTRVVYPYLVGPENARHNSEFSERCSELANAFNPSAFEPYSRMRGFVLRKS